MSPSAALLDLSSPVDSLSWKGHQITTQFKQVSERQIRSVESRTPATIDELIRLRCQETPDDLILSYPFTGLDYVDYTFKQLDSFAARLARKYSSVVPQRRSSSEPEVVVGLLGPSTFEYFITILALAKLGHTVLFLSTRISIPAYVSLLKATGAHHLLIDPSFQETSQSIQNDFSSIRVSHVLSHNSYDAPDADPESRFDRNFDPTVESNKIAWIIHSSGSTGLPKPIYQTNKAALTNYALNLNLRGFITLPLYHAHGISSVFRAIHSRKQIYMYNASLPLTQQNLLTIMRRYEFQIFYGVPYALKMLGETPEGIEALAKLNVVMFGGSACPDTLGKRLVDNGVNLISHYGTTETGQLMTSFRQAGDKDWDYVRVPDSIKQFLVFELRTPGIYELVVLDGLPSKVASNRPDGSYATKDLFSAHPTIPNAWKYYARLDDTIVLVNGEKVTPTMFEQAIRDDSYVQEAVMFGSGKTRVGMLVIPSAICEAMSSNEIETALAAKISKANEAMPGYAQLTMDMVKLLPIGTSYPRTDKGTAIRAAFYRTFESQIDEIYEAAEVSSGTLYLPEPELRQYIRAELAEILSPSTAALLEDDTDFFSVGIDSLQAIRLRTVLSKNIHTNGQNLTSNIIFDFPSIAALARELYRLRTGGESESISVTEQMKKLITKYSVFDAHTPSGNKLEGQYAVVTGATGSLGAHVVSQLVLRPDVKKVYCLVRASSPSKARLRVIRSMRDRCVYHILPLEARQKIEALPADFGKADLGLSSEQHSLITSQITFLLHCAWSVNFNLGLGSFEADCIAGAHNLMALCLKAQRPEPASFNFCSSVSAVASTKGGFVPESVPVDLSCAQNMGYAQSKLVTENICVAAAKAYSLKTRVLRIGQVIADTRHGIWNATEAIPLMIQAAKTIGAVATLDENPLWLPVDIVASALTEISLSAAGAGVMNIVNPQSFHWTRDLIPALRRAGLEFSELGQKEWVSALRDSISDPVANPPIKLLEFFARKYDNDKPRTGLTYDTNFARFLSPSLAAAPVLDQQIVDKFVSHFEATSWRTLGTLTPIPKLIVVIGPCGVAKAAISSAISKKNNIPWIEGDKFHSPKWITKMANGIPLSDDDLWLWLENIKAKAVLEMYERNASAVVLSCSSLRKSYREELRRSRAFKALFIILQGSAEVLTEDVEQRGGDFLGFEMLESQLGALEVPGVEETDILPVDVKAEQEDVLNEVLGFLDVL